jgi:hypothetical protein
MSLPVDFSPLVFRTGYSLDAKPEIAVPDPYGVVEIRIKEVERIEVYLGGEEGYKELKLEGKTNKVRSWNKGDRSDIVSYASGNVSGTSGWSDSGSINLSKANQAAIERKKPIYYGYLVVGNELKPLPIGSTLDSERGIFYWQPGPGFLGSYDFVFVKEDVSGFSTRTRLRLIIYPKF